MTKIEDLKERLALLTQSISLRLDPDAQILVGDTLHQSAQVLLLVIAEQPTITFCEQTHICSCGHRHASYSKCPCP